MPRAEWAREPQEPPTRVRRAVDRCRTAVDIFDVFLAATLSAVLTTSFGLGRATLPAVLGSSFLGMFVGSMLMGAVAEGPAARF